MFVIFVIYSKKAQLSCNEIILYMENKKPLKKVEDYQI